MSILSGYDAYKKHIKTANGYKVVSQWTHPNTVEFDDGNSLLDKYGTTSIASIGDGSITGAISTLNSNKADLVNGTVPVAQLPKVVFDEMVTVANDTARFALTTATVQNGDTVYVTATEKMYLVIDDTHLSTEAGYQQYAASVTWSTISGKPSNLMVGTSVSTASGSSQSPFLHQSDIINTLTSTSTTKPLSAKQGRVLNTSITDINTLMGNTTISSIGDGTVTGALSSLKSDLNGQFAIVTGTTNSTISGYVTATMPSGFTASNTIITGFQFDDGNTWRGLGLTNEVVTSVSISKSDDKLYIFTRATTASNKPFKILLYKSN